MKGEKKQGVFGSWAKAALAAVMMLLAVSGSAEAFEIVYSGKTVVDIRVTQEECGTNRKCELYRDSALVGTWMNLSEDVFFSDTVSPDTVYYYKIDYYQWDSENSKWVYETYGVTYQINTAYMRGDLYNSENNPFKRPPVKWEGKIQLDYVKLWTGTFNFKAGDEISGSGLDVHGKESPDSSPVPGQTPDAFISANGATFKSCVISIYGICETPIFENCTFDNFRISADENCSGMKIINNNLTQSDISTGSYGYAEGNSLHDSSLSMGSYSRAEKNTGDPDFYPSGVSEDDISVGDNSVVADNNNVHNIHCVSQSGYGANDNIVENNSCYDIRFGSRNQCLKNTVEHNIEVDDENLIQDNYVKAFISVSGYKNTITGNRMVGYGGGGIVLSGGENVITDNTIDSKYNCFVISDSSDNRIEDNICEMFPVDYEALKSGIAILGTESGKGSFRNIVKNNKIKAVQNTGTGEETPARTGICLNCPDYSRHYGATKVPDKCKNNEISGNTVEGFAVRGIEVLGNENTVYNNIFRNTTVGENTSPPKIQNAFNGGTGNLWNTSKQSGINIVGGTYLGGNYYDDYTGKDENKDGIGDTPYLIYGDKSTQDSLPLMLKGVNSTGDDGDKDTADGLCDTGKTVVINGEETAECTLRAAIEEANAKDGEDKILFQIPVKDMPVIKPNKALPAITGAVIIDGTSQSAGKVKIDGTNAGESHGININCDGTVLKGLEIVNFRKNGICSAGEIFDGWEPILNYGVSLDKVSVLNNNDSGICTGGKIIVTSGGAIISDNVTEGIRPSSTTGIEAENLEVSRNGICGICFADGELVGGGGPPFIFKNVTVTENKGEGIQAGGDVILKGNNSIKDNRGAGIVGDKVEIEQAIVISGNKGGGIWAIDTVIFKTGGSKVVNNGYAGIIHQGITASNLEVSGNRGDGIATFEGELIGSDFPPVILENVTVKNNEGVGIGGWDITLKGSNYIQDNLGWGIGGNKIEIENAVVSGNRWHGIDAIGDVILTGEVTVSSNKGNGIVGKSLTAANLTASLNGQNGIETEGTVTVTGGGQACGNAIEDIVAGGALNLTDFVYGEGCGDEDKDGSDDTAEDNACAGGDGNGNGIPDRQEKDVATFRDASGKCVTLVSCQGTTITDFKVVKNPSPGDAPAGVSFPSGFFSFRTEGLTSGASCKMKLILHEHNQPESYWNYGATPDNSSNHWYSFLYDGSTGAEIPLNTTARSSDNPVMLNYSDSKRGDHDLKADGSVITLGGLTFRNGLDDLIKVLQLLTGKKVYDIAGIPDVNRDGKIGNAEAVFILRKLSGE